MVTITDNIPIELIDPDVNNPRIAEYLIDNPNPSKKIMFVMLGEAEPETGQTSKTTFAALKKSIQSNGTLINRVLLSKKGERYKVIEGNTRVAIYNSLFTSTQDPKWANIPAEINNDIDETEEHKIRLQAHLVGIREWSPYAKGSYLFNLINDKKLTLSEVAGICGDQKGMVNTYVSAYQDFAEYYMPLAKDEANTQRFSAFIEIQRRKQMLINHGYDMKTFAEWNLPPAPKIVKNEHVRHLDKILSHPEAKGVFLSYDSNEAIKILNQGDPDLSKFGLVDLANEVARRVNNFSLAEINKYRKMNNPNDPVLDSISYLNKCITTFFDEIGFID